MSWHTWAPGSWSSWSGGYTLSMPSVWGTWADSSKLSEEDEEGGFEMEINSRADHENRCKRYAVTCKQKDDLVQERILKCLSIMKSKLMMQCAPVAIHNIECKMTPSVKDNIINAYRKISMYGKKTPFVARFDEYGRRLSDDIRIDTLQGMTIKIVDPEIYGEYFLEFEGIVRDLFTGGTLDLERMFHDCEPFTDFDVTTLYDSEKKTR